ncbi:MAG: energy-coupling factor ABC transporter substrate-binding protein [Propionibacteriaceae bacterium]
MKRSRAVTVWLLVALVAIFAISFVIGGMHTNPVTRFGGTDTAATSQIQATDPNYKPGFTPFFQPRSAEIESGLFALQAAIGGAVLGFAVGGYWGRRKAEKAFHDDSTTPPAGDAADGVL